MNNIGFGIFCFGEEYYYKGTVEKINKILNSGYHCYILTENPDFFATKYSDLYVHIIKYDRAIKSYADKMLLPKHILQKHDICILIDADTHITDYSFLKILKDYQFIPGISYIDTLLNHKAKKEFVKDLVVVNTPEWSSYHTYATKLYPNYGDFATIWEYFLVINKVDFNLKDFYYYYERLQLAKEYSDLAFNKEISGAGEGISIQISANLSNTKIQQDFVLYDLLKDKMISISRRHTRREFWPDWMK